MIHQQVRLRNVMPRVAYKKKAIPRALREQVWVTYAGPRFEAKCGIVWCLNRMTVFDFQCGHNVPESRGGKTNIDNLRPICARCNVSMGDAYTIDEWNLKFKGTGPSKAKQNQTTTWWSRWMLCLFP